MPTVDLTARLARETEPGERDLFLFDRALPGFGLRVHRSGAKAWIGGHAAGARPGACV